MLHLVLNNRPCPGSDQSNPRDRLRAIIFGHSCIDKDVLLKGHTSSSNEEFSAPNIVHQLNKEKYFHVWKNLALHLIEQMGYARKLNCV